MDYELLNKVKKIGVLGCLISGVAAYFMYDATRSFVDLVWPDTEEVYGSYSYDIRNVGDAGFFLMIVGILVALALFVSVVLYSNRISKVLSSVSGISSVIGVLLTIGWLIPNIDVLGRINPQVPISPPQLLQLETLLIQATAATLLSLVLAGIAGIAERSQDKIANVGYILSLFGGVIPLALGLITGGLFVTSYGDIEWVIIAHIIAFIGYIGLAAAFYRPITQPEEHPDIQEQESDSRT